MQKIGTKRLTQATVAAFRETDQEISEGGARGTQVRERLEEEDGLRINKKNTGEIIPVSRLDRGRRFSHPSLGQGPMGPGFIPLSPQELRVTLKVGGKSVKFLMMPGASIP